MEWLAQILVAIVLGAIIGGIARLLLPGVQQIGVVLTIAAGALAVYVGHWIAEAIGVASTSGIDWIKLAIQIVLAMIVVGVIGGVGSRRT